MLDMVLLVFSSISIPSGWREPAFPSEDFLFLLSGWWFRVVKTVVLGNGGFAPAENKGF